MAQPLLGIVYDHALRIVTVDRDSPAALATIEAGDQLIAVNGQTVHTVAEFQRAIQPVVQSATAVEITIKRSGEERRVALRPGWPAPQASTPTPVPSDLYYQ
jgi:S1-C subfamily serine protease